MAGRIVLTAVVSTKTMELATAVDIRTTRSFGVAMNVIGQASYFLTMYRPPAALSTAPAAARRRPALGEVTPSPGQAASNMPRATHPAFPPPRFAIKLLHNANSTQSR